MILPREKQVVSQQTAKRMKDLGLEQKDSLWVWIWSAVDQGYILELNKDVSNKSNGGMLYGCRTHYAAPTTSELGAILPDLWDCGKVCKVCQSDKIKYYCSWQLTEGENKGDNLIYADTLAEAMGLMACYLKEQGLL